MRSDVRDHQKSLLKNEQGFTLLEILAVVVIMGILATLVGPSVFRRLGESRQVTCKDQIELFSASLEHYRLDNGQYPTTEQGLQALWQQSTLPPLVANWNGPYIMKNPPKDPWGRDYVYRVPGEHNSGTYDLYSLGADGQPGGEGEARDITNW